MPSSIYAPLVAYLRDQEDPVVFLTFEKLEAILAMPLARTARVRHDYWTEAAYRHVADLERAGWEAHLHVDAQQVEFRRTQTEGAA